VSTTSRSRRYSVVLIACFLAMTLSACVSHPVKCEIPPAPEGAMEPVEQTDKLQELGAIFNRDWSSTEQDANPSDKK